METENLPVAETKAKKRMPKPLARTLSFLGVTLLCALVTLLGVSARPARCAGCPASS